MSNVKDKISILSNFARESNESTISYYNDFTFNTTNANSVKSQLSDYDINGEEISTNKFNVPLNEISDSLIIVLDDENLRKKVKELVDYNTFLPIKSVAVLIYNEDYLYYDLGSGKTFIGNYEVLNNFLINNLCEYEKLIHEFKKEEFFVDYLDKIKNEGIIYSSTKGILKLTFPITPIKISEDKPIAPYVQNLLNKLPVDQYRIHFKNELFTLEKENNKVLIETIVSNLDLLLQSTENNYQLELKNFSFDKLKSDLQKEKEKYFTSLREILNKILSQVVGVPVSIGASIFASYKVDNIFILFIILIAFSAYVGFAIYFQCIYRKDVIEINNDFQEDFEKISKNSGLNETDIDKEKTKIERRIKIIKTTIAVFIAIVSLLTIMFLWFIIGQMNTPKIEDKTKTINLKGERIMIVVEDSLNRNNANSFKKIVIEKDTVRKDSTSKAKPNSTLEKH